MQDKFTKDVGLARLLLEGIDKVLFENGSTEDEYFSNNSPEYMELLSTRSELVKLIEKAEEGGTIDKSDIERVFSIVPKNAILPVSKISQFSTQLLNGDIPGVIVDKKKIVKVPVMVKREDVHLPENYTRYDDCVHNAVCSLLEAGNTTFTAEMVYRAMNGLSNTEKIRPESLETVRKSIEKQRSIDVYIDYSEQAKEWNKSIKKTTIRGHIIECRVAEGETHNGYKKQVYVLLATPPIYEYSKIFNQVRTIPIGLLNIKNLRNSEQITVIKNYLLTRIETMRGSNGTGKTILYETLFSACDLNFSPSNPAKDAKKYRGYISKILNQWVEQDYISGFSEKKEGRSFVGVTIKL